MRTYAHVLSPGRAVRRTTIRSAAQRVTSRVEKQLPGSWAPQNLDRIVSRARHGIEP